MTLLLRGVYRLHRLTSGTRYWLQQRFTPAGFIVLCGLLAAGLMGPDTENNVAYQAVTLLLALLAIAAIFSWWFRVSFSAQRLLPRFGTVGAPLTYTVVLRNLGRKIQAGLTLMEELADARPSFHEWRAAHHAERKQLRSFRVSRPQNAPSPRVLAISKATLPTARPEQQVEVPMELTPLQRGLLSFSAVRLARPDPLGLFRAFCRIPVSQSTLILPRRYSLPPLSFPGKLKYQDGGVALASSVGQSDEFVSLRDYRHGDPLRHIHWRSWAKAGQPVVKEFEDEFFVRHALVLDTFTDHPFSDRFEEAVSVAASFACAIQTQESLLDLLFVGPQSYCFTAGRGLAHTDQMLEILASVRPCIDQSFRTLENLVLSHINAVSGCVCVLLDWDEGRRNFVKKLTMIGVPLLVLVLVVEGGNTALHPGPLQDYPGQFFVLEVGKVQEGLSALQ